MKPAFVFGGVVLGVLAFACAPRSRSNEASTKTARSQQREPPHLESALAVNADESTSDVRFVFRVINSGGGKIEMQFPSGQTHEVVVLDTLGREVWRWSQGRMFTQVMQNKILRTADTLALDGRWRSPGRGQYVAVARLASANYPIEQRTPFIVR